MGLLTWQGCISLFVLGICGAIAINGDRDIIPVITLIVGSWLPSPVNGDRPKLPSPPKVKS